MTNVHRILLMLSQADWLPTGEITHRLGLDPRGGAAGPLADLEKRGRVERRRVSVRNSEWRLTAVGKACLAKLEQPNEDMSPIWEPLKREYGAWERHQAAYCHAMAVGELEEFDGG